MNTDVEKFKMIYKLGLTKKNWKNDLPTSRYFILYRLLFHLFMGAVALKAMYAVLDQPMQLAGWEVLGVFY